MASDIKQGEDGAKTGNSEMEANEVSNSSTQNCALCGCSTPAVRCDKCNSQTFCLSCDDMYHRHPKRRLHLRKAVDSIWNSHRSPRLRRSTNLPGDPSKIPIPPPRRKKRERFNTFAGSSFPKTPFDISSIARRDSWTSKMSGLSKQNAIVSNNAMSQSPRERSQADPSYENSASFSEQNIQIDPSVNGTPHESVEQRMSNKGLLQPNVSSGNLRKSASTEMDQFANIHMADAIHVSVSPTAATHCENLDERNVEYPANILRGSHLSQSAAELRSMPMSPHFFYPSPQPIMPHHIHPYNPSVAHMNCPQCISASWSNLMSPHMPPYHPQHPWSSASSTLSRKRHVSGTEGQFKPNQTPILDPSNYAGPHVPFPPSAYPYFGPPFYPHGYPAAESPLFMDSQIPVDPQRQAKSPSVSSRVSQNTDRQGESDQMLILAQSSGGEEERASAEEERVTAEEEGVAVEEERVAVGGGHAEEMAEEESEEDDNADEEEPEVIVPEKPNEPWTCVHCTYINPPGSHICEICCKTSYAVPQKEPQKKKKKKEPKSKQKSHTVNVLQDTDAATSSSTAAVDEPMQIDVEQRLIQDSEKIKSSPSEDAAEMGDTNTVSRTEDVSEISKDENLKESDAIENASEIKTVDNFLTTETQTLTYTTSTDVQTQQLLCVSVASSTDSLLNLIKHEISIQTETETQATKQSVATDPMISSQSMESLLSGVSAPPYHNRRAGLGRAGNSFSTQSLSAFERGRSRSPIPRASSMHGETMSFGRGLNSVSQDPIHCSWSRPFWGTDPMYYKPHGLRRLGQSDSREDDFDGTWGSVDRLNKDLKKRKEEKWRSDFTAKPRFHRSLTDLKHDKRPESPHMPEMEFLQIVKDAERFGYTVDDLQVAYLHCRKGDPVLWLEDNWNEMIKNVIALAAKYGQDNEENDVGAISLAEAKEALRVHRGDLWDAVTECIEIRQRKILELTVRGNFTQRQIVEALKNNDGNVELAYADLIRATSRAFKHILSPGLSEESEDITCQRAPGETAAEPIVSIPTNPEKSSTGIAVSPDEEDKAEKKRSDFLTKLSAIRQAQSERRKAREEKELNREVEKVFKESYLETTDEIDNQPEMNAKLSKSMRTVEDLSVEPLPEDHQDALSESVEIPSSPAEVNILQESVDTPDKLANQSDASAEKREKFGDTTVSSIEKDEDIPEDFDGHWIDSQGEWIEEFSDEQWEEEGEEGQGEWVTVRTKYRKLDTELDAEAKQLASLWENEELVDDVFEEDAKNSPKVDENSMETNRVAESSKQDNWVKLNLSQEEEEKSSLKQCVETKGTLKRDQFIGDEYSVKDSENNWIKDSETNEDDMQVKGDWVTIESDEITDKDIVSAGISSEEQIKLLENATAEYKITEKNELQDSFSEQYSEEEWEKVDSHEQYPDSLGENVVTTTTTDDEGQYLGKVSSEEDPDTVLMSSLENIARKRNMSLPTDAHGETLADDTSEMESKVPLMVEPSVKDMPFPPKRQKVGPSSTENTDETSSNAQMQPQLSDVACHEAQLENSSLVNQEQKPPVPIRRKSKVNGLLPEQSKNKVVVPEKDSEKEPNVPLILPDEVMDVPGIAIKVDISNDEFHQTSADLDVSREGEEIFQSTVSYNTVMTDNEKIGRHLVAGGSRYLAQNYSEEVPMEFDSKNASPEPSLTYESDSNCFADSESEFDNKENRKTYKSKDESVEMGFVSLPTQMYLESLEESQMFLPPDNENFQKFSESSSQFADSFVLDDSSLGYVQASSEIPLEYSSEQKENEKISKDNLNIDQYQMQTSSLESSEQYVGLDQYQESMQLVSALSQGFSDREFQIVDISKEPSLPFEEIESQLLPHPMQSQASPILDRSSFSPLMHDKQVLDSQLTNEARIEESAVADTEEIPAFSEMEATSAAADYFFGRYNEITVTRKAKKKPTLAKASKPTSVAPSPVSISSSGSVSGITKSSPALHRSVSPSVTSSSPYGDFNNAGIQEIARTAPIALQYPTVNDALTTKPSSSEEMQLNAPQAAPEDTKKVAPPTEYLSFAEDYFFGSYNEVVIQKKGKKKMPIVKPNENIVKVGPIGTEPAHQPAMKEEMDLAGMAETKSEMFVPQMLTTDELSIADMLEVAPKTQLSQAHSISIIPSHSKEVESKAGDRVDEKISEKETVDVKLPPNIGSGSPEIKAANIVIKETVEPHVEIKNKSVHFQDSEPPVVPPPRRNQKKNQIIKQDSQPSDSSALTSRSQILAQQSSVADKETLETDQKPGSMYTAAEYLFGRYDEITPSTKISTPQAVFVAKKKTSIPYQ